MKKILIIFITLILTACANKQANYIMPPLKYNGPVVHINKNAYVYWRHGTILAGEKFTTQSDDLIVGIIQSQARRNNPSDYIYTYGKAQQAGFITNFRDVLKENHIFKDVEIITNPSDVKPGAVLIEINFKTTRVSGFEYSNKVILTVEMKIASGKNTFIRTYLTESDEGTEWKGKSFEEQIVDASEQMIAKLIGGIKQWSKN